MLAAAALLPLALSPSFDLVAARALGHLDSIKSGVYTVRVQDLAGPKAEPKAEPAESKVWFIGSKARVETYTPNPPGFAPARDLVAYNVAEDNSVLKLRDGPGTGERAWGELAGQSRTVDPARIADFPRPYDIVRSRHPLTLRDQGNRKLASGVVRGERCAVLDFDVLTQVGGPVVHYRFAVCPAMDYAILEASADADSRDQGKTRYSIETGYAKHGPAGVWFPTAWEYRVSGNGIKSGESVTIKAESLNAVPARELTLAGMGVADGTRLVTRSGQAGVVTEVRGNDLVTYAAPPRSGPKR